MLENVRLPVERRDNCNVPCGPPWSKLYWSWWVAQDFHMPVCLCCIAHSTSSLTVCDMCRLYPENPQDKNTIYVDGSDFTWEVWWLFLGSIMSDFRWMQLQVPPHQPFQILYPTTVDIRYTHRKVYVKKDVTGTSFFLWSENFGTSNGVSLALLKVSWSRNFNTSLSYPHPAS